MRRALLLVALASQAFADGAKRPPGYAPGSAPEDPRHAPTRRQIQPRLRVEDPTVVGPLSAEVVRRVVRRNLNQARYCYERELAKNPTLAGRVALDFTIAADGHVSDAVVTSSTLHEVDACLVAAHRRWTFIPLPAPDAGVPTAKVSHALVFSLPDD